MPLLSGLRTLAIGTLLGPPKEKHVDWYLECGHLEKLLNQLTPQLDKIAQIIQHYAISVCPLSHMFCSQFLTPFFFFFLVFVVIDLLDRIVFIQALVVVQDMLRVFIVRIACQKTEHACKLLHPILSGIRDCVSDTASLTDMDTYKVIACITV